MHLTSTSNTLYGAQCTLYNVCTVFSHSPPCRVHPYCKLYAFKKLKVCCIVALQHPVGYICILQHPVGYICTLQHPVRYNCTLQHPVGYICTLQHPANMRGSNLLTQRNFTFLSIGQNFSLQNCCQHFPRLSEQC